MAMAVEMAVHALDDDNDFPLDHFRHQARSASLPPLSQEQATAILKTCQPGAWPLRRDLSLVIGHFPAVWRPALHATARRSRLQPPARLELTVSALAAMVTSHPVAPHHLQHVTHLTVRADADNDAALINAAEAFPALMWQFPGLCSLSIHGSNAHAAAAAAALLSRAAAEPQLEMLSLRCYANVSEPQLQLLCQHLAEVRVATLRVHGAALCAELLQAPVLPAPERLFLGFSCNVRCDRRVEWRFVDGRALAIAFRGNDLPAPAQARLWQYGEAGVVTALHHASPQRRQQPPPPAVHHYQWHFVSAVVDGASLTWPRCACVLGVPFAPLFDAVHLGTNLLQLDLLDAGLSAADAPLVVELLRESPNLRQLALRYNALHHEGAFLILSAAASHQALRLLDVRDNWLTAEEVHRLRFLAAPFVQNIALCV